MHTRRAALVTLTSLRRAIKVCRRNPSEFCCSVEIPHFVRCFGAAAEPASIYSNYDGDRAENQSGHVNFDRNDQFFDRSLGGVEQNQNPGGVYGKLGLAKLNLSNAFGNGNGSVQNVESRSTCKLDDLDQLTREGKLKEAVELLELLEKERIRADLPRFMALVKSCGENEAFAEAKSVHKHLAKSMAHLEVKNV